MDDRSTRMAIAWAAAIVLVVLLGMSFMGNGTWMGGFGMGWMMVVPLLVLGIAIWAAYRFGRMEAKVEDLQRRERP